MNSRRLDPSPPLQRGHGRYFDPQSARGYFRIEERVFVDGVMVIFGSNFGFASMRTVPHTVFRINADVCVGAVTLALKSLSAGLCGGVPYGCDAKESVSCAASASEPIAGFIGPPARPDLTPVHPTIRPSAQS